MNTRIKRPESKDKNQSGHGLLQLAITKSVTSSAITSSGWYTFFPSPGFFDGTLLWFSSRDVLEEDDTVEEQEEDGDDAEDAKPVKKKHRSVPSKKPGDGKKSIPPS